MAIINIREAKTYHSKESLNDKLAKILSVYSPKISALKSVKELATFVYKLMRENNCVDMEVIKRLNNSKNLNSAFEKVYNLILCREGNGVLKEYSNKKIAFHGTAIRGMEVHSPGH